MSHDRTAGRDPGLDLVLWVNRWLIPGAVVCTVGVSLAAARRLLNRGAVTARNGTEIEPQVSDAGGGSLILNARLQIDPGGAVAGMLSATAGGQG
jgi:hypothetical protein